MLRANTRSGKTRPLRKVILPPKQSRVRTMDADRRDLDKRRRRILWRAMHRGTRELDLVLGGFVRDHIATMKETELTELEDLVDLADPLLAGWIFQGHRVADACLTATAARLLAWRAKFT
jgi:antitoxin CptB